MKMICLCSCLCFLFGIINAKTINVPTEQPKIQTAINVASNGDTILVAPGTYFENVNFGVKNLVLSSYYILNNDTSYISKTIIDGSKPSNPDTASCILIVGKQDSTTILQGFTITKGKGTRSIYSNGWFREGGGVFVDNAAPVIKNNLIIGNEVLNATNVTSAGGGGIRSNLGNPRIYNNVIVLNKALYGAAMVLDYSNSIVKNNLIYRNTGASNYGGGAFWIYDKSAVIENNTITANSGGIFSKACKTTITNNIVWGNAGYQVDGVFPGEVKNNNIQGGYKGSLSLYPLFKDTSFILEPSSPIIDQGLDSEPYNDTEDPLNTGNALSPSLGKVRNDIGAYGGPNAAILPSFEYFSIVVPGLLSFGSDDTIGKPVYREFAIVNLSTKSIRIDSIKKSDNSQIIVKSIPKGILMPIQSDTIGLEWTPQNDLRYKDTLLVYHNITTIENPLKVATSGRTKQPASLKDISSASLINIFPNPFKESAIIQYKGVTPNSKLDIFDLNGKVVRSVKIENTEGNITLNGNGMSTGIYIYILESENSVLNGKFVINK